MVRGTQNLQPLRVVESWPLFNWPAEFVQLRLFSGHDTSTGSDGTVPRQLELSLLAGDDASTWSRQAREAKQLTLFVVDQRSEITTPNHPHAIDDCPLFHWPPNVVQLRLFAGASDDHPSAGDVPAEQPPPDQAEHAERSLVDPQHGLHRQWSQIRAAEYRRRFGAYAHIARPQDASGVPVDVYVFPPNQHRPVTTLVTSGLSNHRMPVPPGRFSPRTNWCCTSTKQNPNTSTCCTSWLKVRYGKTTPCTTRRVSVTAILRARFFLTRYWMASSS